MITVNYNTKCRHSTYLLYNVYIMNNNNTLKKYKKLVTRVHNVLNYRSISFK